MSAKSKVSVLKAASDIAVHPKPHIPEFEHHQKPRHVKYATNVLHHNRKGKDAEAASRASTSSATASVSSELTEAAELCEQIKIKSKEQRHQLKLERFHFREFVPYNVQFPHRVAVRLQRLLATTNIHLNDPGFVNKLQDKIREDEDADLVKHAERRAKIEFDRVKQLIIDGAVDVDNDSLTPDLEALKQHPVYRVKQMLNRLDRYDTVGDVTPPKTKIIPIEPFEYNATKFFKHLHRTGDIHWVPKKIRRERQRESKLRKSQTETADRTTENPENLKLRTLYKRSMSVESSDSNEEMSGSEPEQHQHNNSPETAPTSTNVSVPATAFDLPKENDLKQFLQEQILAEAFEHRKRDQEWKEEELTKQKSYADQRRITIKWHNELVPREGELKADLEDRSSPPTLIPDSSFERIRKSYGVSSFVDTYQHKLEDPMILHLIDEVNDANELFGNAEALSRLYAREARFVDKILPTLQRRYGMDL